MKSEMPKRITATTAARRFSDVLDTVEHGGVEYVIERHGRAVARLSPASTTHVGTTTWGEWLRAMRNAPRPDPEFARDLARIRRSAGKLPKDPWGSSSTRRS